MRLPAPSAPARLALAVLALASGSVAAVAPASAVSLRVKLACAADYYANCSDHAPDSPGVRQCMRANGLKLSRGCIDALVAAGEVSQGEVARRAASAR